MDLNISCQHITNKIFSSTCIYCGCIHLENKDNIIYTIKPKAFTFKPEFSLIDQFKSIEKAIGYRSYFSKNRSMISDFYKKARISCIKFIKLLYDEYKCSYRVYVTSILYLDLIYLNYDYYSTLKDFKSELIALGCFLIACKIKNI